MTTVHVTGIVRPNGRFTTGWWTGAPDGTARPGGPDGGWAAVALDADGRTLTQAAAQLTTIPLCPGDGDLAERLAAFLPLPPGTAAVVVRHDGVEVTRRAVPAPAGVTLDTAALLGRTLARAPVEVPVIIDGSPPAPGAYLVGSWEAPGQPVSPLRLVDVGNGAPAVVRLDLTALPGGDGCLLSVRYHDGVRTTTVTSPPLAVEARPVTITIASPGPDAVLHDNGIVLLSAHFEGDGDPAEMEWLFDADVVGQGHHATVRRPEAGPHTVTLRHGAASVNRDITVRAAPAPPAAPRWEPPWRTGPIRSIGR